MSHEILSADTLYKMDEGLVGSLIDYHLRNAVRDIIDRPGEAKPRKFTLTFTLKPVVASGGTVDKVGVVVTAKPAYPPHQTRSIDTAVRASGSLIFSADSPENVDQETFGFPKDKD